MSESTTKSFPDWEMLYKNQRIETMPWYNENLDSDLQEELDKRKISADDGKKFLDLGTGPATQAIMLSKRGFIVVGSDLSEAAINRARKIYPNNPNVNFIVDDILNTRFKDDEFDYIFDRGCFHVLSSSDRKKYINKIQQILKKQNGMLFLKCFSDKDPRQEGPYKFSQDEIRDLFGKSFNIHRIEETVYQGTLDPLPKALFVVMTNK
jgi:SAM-dependent methyltransferase